MADNGSTDGTSEAARRRGAIIVSESERGYGAACLKAIDWIKQQDEPPDVIVFLDADLSDDPTTIPLLINPIARNEADIVIGSRFKLAEPGALNFTQRFGNALACFLIAQLTDRRHSDLGPLRAIKWSTFQQLNMVDRNWGWTIELQMKAAILDIPFVEIDVPYHKRKIGRSKISGTILGSIKAGWKITTTIFKLWFQRRSIIESQSRSEL